MDPIQGKVKDAQVGNRNTRTIAWGIGIGSLITVVISTGFFLEARSQQKQAELKEANSLAYHSLSLRDEGKDLDAFVPIIPPEMGGISKFSEGLAVVKVNDKYGYMDTSGTVVIPTQFDEAHVFSEGLAAARLGEKWGYINRQGQFVISAQYQGFPGKFLDGLATIHLLSGETGIIDQEGKWVIAPQSNPIQDFSEGLAAISVNGKYGYIDKTGKMVIEPQFQFAGVFSEGLAPVISGTDFYSKWGYIDKTGKVVIAPQFYNAQPFSNGLAAVALAGNQWGYIDSSGTVIIPGKFYTPQYFPYSSDGGAVSPFSPDGVAMARVGEKIGFINRKGEWIIQPTFSDGTDFGDGFARVNSGGIWMPGEADPNHPEGIPAISLSGGVWGYIRVMQ